MKTTFRPITRAEYALAERFKRATAVASMGDDKLFDVWFPPERSYAMYLDRKLARDPACCAFLEIDSVTVGAVELRILDNGQGHLSNVYLEPEWRGKRLGEVLDGYAMAFFKKHGAEYATLRTNPKQPKVIAFYERLGWQLGREAEHGLVWMGRDVS